MYSRLVDRMSLLQYKAPSCHTVLIQYASKSEEEPENESACNSSIASADRSVVPKLLVVGWCLQPGLLCLGRNSFLAFSCKSLIHTLATGAYIISRAHDDATKRTLANLGSEKVL